MLTCPPTRINLTASDVSEFEHRFLARQVDTSRRISGGGLRVGRSPGRPTRFGFVPAIANVGRRRAESCSSQATIWTSEDEDVGQHDSLADETRSSALTSQVLSRTSPVERATIARPPSSWVCSALDGADGSSARLPLISIRPGRVQHEPPDIEHSRTRALSNSRDDFGLHEDPHYIQRHIERQHLTDWAARRRQQPQQRQLPPIRDRNIPTIVTQPPTNSPLRDVQTSDALPNPALDPSAPVFMPRTRFASTLSSAADFNDVDTRVSRQGSSMESAQSSAYLRIRSSSERNSQHSSPGLDNGHSEIEDIGGADGTVFPQHRLSRRANDQNAALQRPIPNLDRYPAIRPLTAAMNARSTSNPHRGVVLPRRQSSRQHLVEFERTRRPPSDTDQDRTASSVRYGSLAVPLPPGGPRSSSPAGSTTSQSTPNLLNAQVGPRFPARSSSLRQKRTPHHDQEHNATSAGRDNRTTQSGTESSSAIRDDWLYRDSPLDELAQHFGRLAARPRSVGRSFERSLGNHGRVSLLAGDPFRLNGYPDGEADACSLDESDPEYATFEARVAVRRRVDSVVDLSKNAQQAEASRSHETSEEDPVALALALPSPEMPSSPVSSPTHTVHQETPTTASLRTHASQSTTPRPKSPPAASSTPQFVPVHTGNVTNTPRVPVYNDSLSPNAQPQTPADMFRRNRGRSDVSTSARRRQANEGSIESDPRTPYRHTYPSAVLPQQSPEHIRSPDRMPMVTEQPIMETLQAARAQQRGSGSSENEIEPVIAELEDDRRTWMRRQEDGSLDVTPPAEGRFERFLS